MEDELRSILAEVEDYMWVHAYLNRHENNFNENLTVFFLSKKLYDFVETKKLVELLVWIYLSKNFLLKNRRLCKDFI